MSGCSFTRTGPATRPIKKLQLTKFGDVALPLYAVVNPATGAVVDKYAGTITNVPISRAFCRSLFPRLLLLPHYWGRGGLQRELPGRLTARRSRVRRTVRQTNYDRLHGGLVRQLQRN